MVDSLSGMWSLDLCRGWDRIAAAQAFDFRGVERWLAQGEWTAESSAAGVGSWSPNGTTIDGVAQKWGPADVDTVRLVRDGEIVFAGIVTPVSEGVGGFESERTGNGTRWRWSGADLWHLLASRVAFPDPATLPPWGSAYDVRTGTASAVAAAYLQFNIGANALAVRKLAGFSIVDQGAGATGTWSARLQPLSDLIIRICQDRRIGCWLSLDWDGSVFATLGAPRDLSERIVISDQADLVNVKLRKVGPTTTWVVAGGTGTGVSRAFATADAHDTGMDRVEMFSDQSSLSQASELQASADVAVLLGSDTWAVSAEVTDDLARRLRYGRDFRLGETITIEVDKVRYHVPVTAAAFEVNSSRQVVRPQLGDASPDELRGLIRDVGNLAARFDRNIN